MEILIRPLMATWCAWRCHGRMRWSWRGTDGWRRCVASCAGQDGL